MRGQKRKQGKEKDIGTRVQKVGLDSLNQFDFWFDVKTVCQKGILHLKYPIHVAGL